MQRLVRKINKSKWLQVDIFTDYDVSADAITNCLKTTKNTLSVWSIEDDNFIESAVLAIVASQDRLETIDVVILEESILEKDITIIESDGLTPVLSLVKSHRDLGELTFAKLEIIKNHIVDRIRSEKCIRYTKGKTKQILLKAIDEGILKIDDLNESMKSKIS